MRRDRVTTNLSVGRNADVSIAQKVTVGELGNRTQLLSPFITSAGELNPNGALRGR